MYIRAGYCPWCFDELVTSNYSCATCNVIYLGKSSKEAKAVSEFKVTCEARYAEPYRLYYDDKLLAISKCEEDLYKQAILSLLDKIERTKTKLSNMVDEL